MEAEFWLERWQRNQIGFHRASVHPLLTRLWQSLGIAPAASVLVPLCGKSLDMLWLRGQGHPVTGVERVGDALAQFVVENGLDLPAANGGYAGGGWNLVESDWFAVALPEPLPAFYDRAALVALPPDLRKAYVEKLVSLLAPGATGLLITMEYDQRQMNGPPFSVPAAEVREHYAQAAEVRELARNDILAEEPHFAERGLTALHEVAWLIRL